jgi:acylphosphatase
VAEAPTSKTGPVRTRVVLHGKVAGIGLRTALEKEAHGLGVAGWVRNNADGTVEAVFEGDPAAVDRLVDFARRGPAGAVVEHVEPFDEPPEGLTGFSVRAEAGPATAPEGPAATPWGTATLPRIFVTAQGPQDPDPFGRAEWGVRPQVRPGDVLLVFTPQVGLAYAARAASEPRRPTGSRYAVADIDPRSWFRLARPVAVTELQSIPILSSWPVLPSLRSLDRLQPGPLTEPILGALLAAVTERDPAFLAWLTSAVRRPYRVGFSADATGGIDMLGIQDRVEFVASVLAAGQLETPLAVGLFGDWGSGKSFFMSRMQERVDQLAELSAQAEEDGEPSLYCSHILQIPFNAWLYSDSDIWPSLAARVFRSVAGRDPAAVAAEDSLQTQHLDKYRERVQNVAKVREEEAELQRQVAELDAEIEDKKTAVAEQATSLGGVAGRVAQTLDLLSELRESLGRIARDWRSIRVRDILVVAALPVALLVAWLGWSARVAGAIAVLTAALAVVARAVRYVDKRIRLQRELEELQEERDGLEQEREERTAERTHAEDRLGDAVVLPLLPEYAAVQATLWAGRERLGVVTEIRLAFERLRDLIESSRLARRENRKHDPDQLPVDRVIVYVDDLDRCSHEVVIQVLESIKVLLDLKHFVVVVGVDPRWLFRSIQVHFAEVLRPDGTGRADDAWAATPQNYLEKIFQYSLVLRPMDEHGFGRLIESLLAQEPAGPGHDATSDGDEPDEEPGESTDLEESATEVKEPETEAEETDAVDLTPDELLVTPAELEFMKSLAALYETPRAAKRLANVYRLIRVTVGADRLDRDQSYEPALVLLSIAIAFPALAGDVFRAIRRHRGVMWDAFVKGLRPVPGNRPGPLLVLERETLTPAESNAWTRLANALDAVGRDELSDRNMEQFEPWIEVVADFSFHPWQELLPAGTRA